MIRLLICGDRNWRVESIINSEVARNKEFLECVIEGEAKGADTLGKICAYRHNVPVLPFPANWTNYGRAAGPVRNTQMLREGKPTEVWAFHNNIRESIGTANMVIQAWSAGLPVSIYSKSPGAEGTFDVLSSLAAPKEFSRLVGELIDLAKQRKKNKTK